MPRSRRTLLVVSLFLFVCTSISTLISLKFFGGNVIMMLLIFFLVLFALIILAAFKRSGEESRTEEQEELRCEEIRARRARLRIVR
jgi:putative effector of murein hydrolase LrgA (UPF0299 family)